MNEEWWESPVCYVCDYWWLLLLLLVLGLAAFFTRPVWGPAIFPPPTPTPTPTPTATPIPTNTPIPLGLSDIRVDSQNIRLSLSDNGNQIDGDMITVSVNDEVVVAEHTLTSDPFEVPLTLNSGANEVVITALNEGSAPPNTVEVSASNVIDGPPIQISGGMEEGDTETFTIYAP